MDRVWQYVTGWEIPSYVSASKENIVTVLLECDGSL